jgi:hypothetical protein
MRINNPTFDWGELITSYEGRNIKIRKSEQNKTYQHVKMLKSLELNGGEEAFYCFSFQLLKRKFLMALDQEKLYEIIKEGDEVVYIKLTKSWFYILHSFEENNKIVFQISLNLHYQYSHQAEYIEPFELQINWKNQPTIKEWIAEIRVREEEI